MGAAHIIPGASQVGGSGQSILFVAAGQPVSIGKQREGVGQLSGPMGPGHTICPSGQLTGQCIIQLPAFSGIQVSGPIWFPVAGSTCPAQVFCVSVQ